jgi:hypothetical protein
VSRKRRIPGIVGNDIWRSILLPISSPIGIGCLSGAIAPPPQGVGNWREKRLGTTTATHKGRERKGAGVGLLCHDDEISVLARLRAKALIGDQQGGARGYQRGNALKRFRREFDTVKRVGSGAARGIGG